MTSVLFVATATAHTAAKAKIPAATTHTRRLREPAAGFSIGKVSGKLGDCMAEKEAKEEEGDGRSP
jgi:hypothetical protein